MRIPLICSFRKKRKILNINCEQKIKNNKKKRIKIADVVIHGK